MEQDRNSKFIKFFEENRKKHEQIAASNEEFSRVIKNMFNSIIEHGKLIEKSEKQNLTAYLNGIQIQIGKLNDETEICRFLLSEKRKYEAKIVEAAIQKNGYDRKYFQMVIDQVIMPLYKSWEEQLEFRKRNPTIKQSISTPNIIASVLNSNRPKVETKQIAIAPLIEKASPQIVEITPKLPNNFVQIKCEASKEEILKYFMILAKEKNEANGNFYMKEEDIVGFVKRNFSAFNSPPTEYYFPINLGLKQKNRLIYFIYEFYIKYDRNTSNNVMKYVVLLINNFDLFKNDKAQSLITNMSESKKPVERNRIPTKKYFLD